MGCCYSILEAAGLRSASDFQQLSTIDEDNLPLNKRKPSPAVEADAAQATAKEKKIELVFRSKRTNVFSTGFDVGGDFESKVVPKTKRQKHLLSEKYFDSFVYMFRSFQLVIHRTCLLFLKCRAIDCWKFPFPNSV